MALTGSQYPRGSALTTGLASAFIPDLWSTEIKRERDLNFVVSRYVKMLSGQFSKGNRLQIPMIGRAAVNPKIPETPVMLQARNEGTMTLDIDRFMESSFMLEDLLSIQSSYNLRSEYTREAGYALGRDIDNYVLALRAVINGVHYAVPNVPTFGVAITSQASQRVISLDSAGTAVAPLNYQALLAAKMQLDKAAVPESDRVLIVSPTQYNQLLAIDKFISMDYGQAGGVGSGRVGSIFGIPVIMSSNIGANSTTGYYNGSGAVAQPTPGVASSPYLPTQDTYTTLSTSFSNSTTYGHYAGTFTTSASGGASEVHTAIMCHKEWAVMAVQKTPSSESSRETLYLSDAVVNSHVYGGRVFRPDHAVVIHTSGVIPSVT